MVCVHRACTFVYFGVPGLPTRGYNLPTGIPVTASQYRMPVVCTWYVVLSVLLTWDVDNILV